MPHHRSQLSDRDADHTAAARWKRRVRGERTCGGRRRTSMLRCLAGRASVLARGVAQLGRALRSGRRGPQFKSGHPDHSFRNVHGLRVGHADRHSCNAPTFGERSISRPCRRLWSLRLCDRRRGAHFEGFRSGWIRPPFPVTTAFTNLTVESFSRRWGFHRRTADQSCVTLSPKFLKVIRKPFDPAARCEGEAGRRTAPLRTGMATWSNQQSQHLPAASAARRRQSALRWRATGRRPPRRTRRC